MEQLEVRETSAETWSQERHELAPPVFFKVDIGGALGFSIFMRENLLTIE